MNEAEIFTSVYGYDGYYEISNLGNIRSVRRVAKHNYGGDKIISGKPIKPFTVHKGYQAVSLCKNGVVERFTVHRLVLLSFKGRKEGMVCCHGDGNNLNNRLSNLRWDTPSGNEQDKVLSGTSNAGTGNHFSVLDEGKVLAIRAGLGAGVSGVSLAEKYGVRPTTISAIKARRSWAHI